MKPKYTAHRIEGTKNGWMLTDNETGEKHVVFCRADANTAEDAAALLGNKNEENLT
jgi:hypothetical protein